MLAVVTYIVPSISTESFGSDFVSVNGQDPRNNNYMLDGGNNNDDVIGQRAGTQARTPIEAIQELQVITGQYDAEYGRPIASQASTARRHSCASSPSARASSASTRARHAAASSPGRSCLNSKCPKRSGSTGFCWVLQGSTGFVLGSTRFREGRAAVACRTLSNPNLVEP